MQDILNLDLNLFDTHLIILILIHHVDAENMRYFQNI